MQKDLGPPGRRWGLSWAQGSLFTQHFKGTHGGGGKKAVRFAETPGSSGAKSLLQQRRLQLHPAQRSSTMETV